MPMMETYGWEVMAMNEDLLIKIPEYIAYLEREERSIATRQQYQRDIRDFFGFIQGAEITKEQMIGYKEELQKKYQPTSVNAKLAALNGFFSFAGETGLRVKPLKIQHKAYCSKEKELSKAEYLRLIAAANQQANAKLALLLQTICGTGIRVSELCFVTAEAVRDGETTIRLKGKTRTILISGKLRKTLKEYLRRQKIQSGPVFTTRTGNPLDRSNIWKMMKHLCKSAGVSPEKVFPHNLRHLFARCFYSIDKDIAKLADVLGHSNINTTRIYIVSSGYEHQQRMDSLGLVI